MKKEARAVYNIYKGISVQQYRTWRPPHINSELVKVEHLWCREREREEEEEEEKVRGKQREGDGGERNRADQGMKALCSLSWQDSVAVYICVCVC